MNEDADSGMNGLLAGQAALQRGDAGGARCHFEAVLADAPNNLSASIGLALSMALSGHPVQGRDQLLKLLADNPAHVPLLDAIGVISYETHDFADAEMWFRKSMRIGGFASSPVANLGMALNELGRFREARSMFKKCLRSNPDDVSARYHLGLCQLLMGEYTDGWQGFALRNAVAGRKEPTLGSDIPIWQGEPILGKKLGLVCEQGLGDTIQFARFAKCAADAGATVYLQCDPSLGSVLQTVPGIAGVFASDGQMPTLDYQAPLLGLPKAFDIMPSSIPLSGGYIAAPQETSTVWREKLGMADGTLNVGLVWAGNPDNKTDYKRSIALADLQPILQLSGADFYSLQIGEAAAELDALPQSIRPITAFDKMLPFSDVAAAMCGLDLIVTVDTSLAHLAGALGVPVWMLITYVPDWRWGLESDRTNWYDSMRLFRQPSIGNWQGVVSDVRDAMTTALQAHQA